MNTDQLKQEIAEVFPLVDKPQGLEISFHKDDCTQCRYLRDDLAEFTGRELSPEGIRCIHHEMSCLSSAGWRWALPSYLRYSITQEAVYHQTETEFLIYNLRPELKYQVETLKRLSALNSMQIKCLIHFLEWCQEHEHWGNYCSEDIPPGIAFLSTIEG